VSLEQAVEEARAVAVESFNEHTLAGLAVGIVAGGRLVHTVSLGLADAERGVPVTPQTVFRIGSISKTMTAVGVLQLVEAGLVGLDDPVNEHLRSTRIAERGAPVTVRHLLTHTGGIGELRRWSDLFRPTIGIAAKPGQAPALAEFYAPALRAEVEPGLKWAYANHGFALLGQLVEDVTGEPFADAMRARLFEPLGMRHTDFLRSERVEAQLAVGYHLRRRGLKPVKYQEIVVAGAGSVFSSVEDMALYAAALAGGGANEHGRVLAPKTLALMLEPQDEPSPRLPAMGLAFMLERAGEHVLAGHDGGWSGFVSSLLFSPDAGLGVVAFTNTTSPLAPHDVSDRLLRRALDVEDEPAVPDSPHLWPELLGLYKLPRGLNTNFRMWPVLGGEVEVTVRKGHLAVRAPSPMRRLRKGVRLHALDESDPLVFEARESVVRVPVAFSRGAGGRIESVRAATTRGGFVRLERRSRLASLRLWGRVAGGAAAAAGATAVVRRARRSRWRS
jgi:CubicO group peptidase (beta-lactamase class C family)